LEGLQGGTAHAAPGDNGRPRPVARRGPHAGEDSGEAQPGRHGSVRAGRASGIPWPTPATSVAAAFRAAGAFPHRATMRFGRTPLGHPRRLNWSGSTYGNWRTFDGPARDFRLFPGKRPSKEEGPVSCAVQVLLSRTGIWPRLPVAVQILYTQLR